MVGRWQLGGEGRGGVGREEGRKGKKALVLEIKVDVGNVGAPGDVKGGRRGRGSEQPVPVRRRGRGCGPGEG
jgi:hypothetical protein